MSFLSRSKKIWIGPSTLVAITWLILQPLAFAESPHESELNLIRNANLAIEEIASARLEVETHYLDQIRSLRADGHSSWLEVARQEAVVDSIRAQRDSLHSYQRFIENLATQLSQIPGSQLSPEDPAPWKLQFPGSMRLAGWLDGNSLPPILKKRKISAANSDLNQIGQKQIEQAQEKVKRFRSRVSQFENADTIPDHWRLQARLQLKLAEAELKYMTARRQLVPAASHVIEVEMIPGSETFLHADQGPDLHRLVQQVAWAEANASAGFRTRELELQRQQQKLAALKKLHQREFASAKEVSKIQNAVDKMSQQLGHEQDRIRFLKQQLDELASTTAAQDLESHGASLYLSRLEEGCCWPTQVLTDLHQLRHLVDLRRRYYDLEGQLAAEAKRMQMQEAYLEKLLQATGKPEKQNANVVSRSKLKTVLAQGQVKEIETLELEIEIFKARVQDFGERLAIHALEEERFIAQCLMQNHLAGGSFVSLNSAPNSAGFPALATSDVDGPSGRRFGYFETGHIDWSQVTIHPVDRPDYLSFSLEQRKSSPLIHSNRYPVTFYPARRRTEPRNLSLYPSSRLYQRSSYDYSSPVLPLPFSIGPRNNNSTYSSQYVYPFGNLRPELRSRVPVGQIPFYLPGLPTNVR